MITCVLGVLLLAAAGLPLGFALTRSWPLALVFSPLTGAAVAVAGVLLMTWCTGPLLLWVAVAFLFTVWLAWRLRRLAPLAHGRWSDALLLFVPLIPPYLMLGQEPMGWDAQLIWWMHAGYFAQGGEFTRLATGNLSIGFGHQDYPPMGSAAVALVWKALGTREYYPAAIVTGVVTMAASATVVYAVRAVTAKAPALVSWPAAIAVGLSAFSPLWIVPTAGFSDVMCATAFAAGAVLLLFGSDPFGRRTLPLILFLLCSAGLMKNEGQSMVIALALVGSVKYRRNIRHVGWVWLPVAVSGIWSVTARLLGATTDVLTGGRFGKLLHGDPDTVGRFKPIFSTMYHRVDQILLFALAVVVLGLLFLRRRRREFGLEHDLWLWAVVGLYWGAVTLIYMITPNDLKWHLGSSVDRVVICAVVLACASAACWAAVAWYQPAAAEPPAVDPSTADTHAASGSQR
ncbi:hypothetical protein [Dactylosporangium salmoneum]|uniref:Integral membrane protein n=1 Tax=Dactylosporangium salmoneum TaxID=53361 RepID=A0ABP5U419_9ACTN